MIEFKCVGCKSKLEVEDAAAGNKIKCPDCGKIMDVPGADLPPLGFLCNNCGTELEVSAFQAGKLIPCTQCGCMVLVPPLKKAGSDDKAGCLGAVLGLGLVLVLGSAFLLL